MKKKTIIILIIVSILIFIAAFFSWFTTVISITNSTYNYHYDSLLMVIGLPLIIFNIIPLIWMIYTIIYLYRKKKNNEFKTKQLIVGIIMLVLVVISSYYFITSVNRKHIEYQGYHIYQVRNNVDVYTTAVQHCWNDPCPYELIHTSIEFSSKNMKVVNNFIDELFKNQKSKSIVLNDSKLSGTQKKILESIINNDETYLNDTSPAAVSITYKNTNNKEYKIERSSNSDKITVTSLEQVLCIQAPCPEMESTKAISFSLENTKKVNSVIDGLIKKKGSNKIQVTDTDLTNEEHRIIKAIINNDETYMKESSEKELSYTLQSHKIKCPTVLLKVYTDKTYEYINGDTISVGSFPYSMAEIILNVYDYDSGNGDVYEIKTKDNIATTIYDNNGKLKEMLSLSNINLDVCEQPTLVN